MYNSALNLLHMNRLIYYAQKMNNEEEWNRKAMKIMYALFLLIKRVKVKSWGNYIDDKQDLDLRIDGGRVSAEKA